MYYSAHSEWCVRFDIGLTGILSHYSRLQAFQLLAFKEIPKLRDLALANVGSIEKRNDLCKRLYVLSAEELKDVVCNKDEKTMPIALQLLNTGNSFCTEDNPVSPTNKEEMLPAPEIFTFDDTIWVANEEMLEDSSSLQHDYWNVIESAIEKYPIAIPYETLDSPPQIVISSNQQYPNALMN